MTTEYRSINLQNKFSRFDACWQPKIVAELNDYQLKLVRVLGEFTWHTHHDTDELFMVIEGSLRIEFRDGAVALNEGEMFVVPKGREHRPVAEKEAKVMLIEPRGIVNTGDKPGALTAAQDAWI